MNILENIVKFFESNEKETKDKTPKGLCPVCWGYQEYDKKIRTLYHDKQIDVNNHKEKYSMMQDFVTEHINGIKLKEGEISTCPKCGHQEKQKDEINN